MTQQYKDITEKIKIEVNEEDRKYVEKYYRNAKISKYLMLMALFVAVMIPIMDIPYGFLIQIIILGLCLGHMHYRGAQMNKIQRILVIDCNPEKYLSVYISLLSYRKEKQSWGVELYNLGTILFYAGRLEDVSKILVIEKGGNTFYKKELERTLDSEE